MPGNKLYFITDAHLGAGPDTLEREKELCTLLNRMAEDASMIIFLGDMFDFWFTYRHVVPRGYTRLLGCMAGLADRGITLHYFVGNHDMWTFGGLAQMTGAEIHYEPCTIQRYGKSLFLAHGDGLLPDNWETLYPLPVQKKIRRFMKLRRIFHSPFLQFCFRCLHPKVGNWFGYSWAKKSRLKELANPCPYKGEHKEELVLFAKDQEKQGNHRDYYIFGHRHIELDLQLDSGARVIILGDCFRMFTYAKLDHKGHLPMHNFESSETGNE